MEVDVSWIDYSLLKIVGRYLIRAASLRSILIIALVLHVFHILRPVILWRVWWFRIRLSVVIISTWTCLSSTRRRRSLRMTWLHIILLLWLLNLEGVIIVVLSWHIILMLSRYLLNLTLICVTILIDYESSFVAFICLAYCTDLLSRSRRQLLLLRLLLLLLLQTIWLIDVNNFSRCAHSLLAKCLMFLKLSLVKHLTSQALRTLNLLKLWLLLLLSTLGRRDRRWSCTCVCWLLSLR